MIYHLDGLRPEMFARYNLLIIQKQKIKNKNKKQKKSPPFIYHAGIHLTTQRLHVCYPDLYNHINLGNKEMITSQISDYNELYSHFLLAPIMTFLCAGVLGESTFNLI